MAQLIHKVDVPIDAPFTDATEIPGFVVHAAIAPHTTPGCVSVWFRRSPDIDALGITTRVKVIATGHPFDGEYLATVVDPAQPLVWHVVTVGA